MTHHRKKICFFLNSISRGGAGRLISLLDGHLDKNHFELSFLTLVSDTSFIKSTGIQSPVYTLFSDDFTKAHDRAKKIDRFFQKNTPDLVVCFTAYHSPYLSIPAASNNIPVLFYCSTDLPRHIQRLTQFLPAEATEVFLSSINEFLSSCSAVFTFGKNTSQSLKNAYGFEADQTIENLRSDFKLTNSERNGVPGPKIISSGRLVYEKGFHDLIHASVDLPLLDITIIGNGPEKESLEKLIKETKSSVKLLPFISDEDTFKQFQTADLFVLPSHYEAFPGIILDAMQAGLPIVATDVGELSNILKKGAPLAIPANPTSLSQSIKTFFEQKDLFIRAPNEYSKILERCSPQSILEKWSDILSTNWKHNNSTDSHSIKETLRELMAQYLCSYKDGIDIYGTGQLAGHVSEFLCESGVLVKETFDRNASGGAKLIDQRKKDTLDPLIVCSIHFRSIIGTLKDEGHTGPIYRFPEC